jgi:adenosylcobinamide-GDP ribazoletransferase
MVYKQNLNNALRFAISYFTILPIKLGYFDANKKFYKGVVYSLPIVGFILASIVTIFYNLFFQNSFYGAFLGAVLYIFLTGFLHLEAVCDTIDGWYASYSKKDVYEVMHDPQAGSIGAIATFVIALMQIVAIVYILYSECYIVLFFSFILSRFGVYFALRFEFHKKSAFILSMKQSIKNSKILDILFLPLNILVNIILNILKNRLGFLNGDTLGFMIVVVEIILLNIGILLC